MADLHLNSDPTSLSPPYRFEGNLATILDPAFFRCWMDNEEYIDRLVQSDTPEDTARRRVVVDFQRELARLIASGRLAEDIDALLERFLSSDYRQHDPHLGNGRAPLAAFFRGALEAGIDLWPPMPICIMNAGEVVSLLLQGAPSGDVERFVPTMFRVRTGQMTEHWSAALPPPPPEH
ncbi:hypothetical protein E6B08_20055 [Pseudomonas putida]|uniref:Uncharacterized protein n=1 Tax=Pseudomonas putida TaxID=303 RepID=A0A4D6XCK8_PSEPU|nr:hypothetical protein [Pseudomonas putida]QCI13507.1 hypothetical protein E6B08_20055 [Pseudomonas putida]